MLFRSNGTEITNDDFNQLKFTNENGQVLSIERLRYLISEVSLTHESGEETVLNDYNLVDLTNNEGMSFRTSEGVLPGEYSAVTFRFGFKRADNADGAYPDLNTANFNVPAPLGGGYHFMQFDGKYTNTTSLEAPFNYHVISAIDPTNVNDAVDTSYTLNIRSEEHTSELQSLAYLVCRLLLEKKKKQRTRKLCGSIIRKERAGGLLTQNGHPFSTR